MPTLEEIREALLEKSRSVGAEYEHAKTIVSNPYASHEAWQEMFQKRGEWYGVGMAIEVFDATVRESEK